MNIIKSSSLLKLFDKLDIQENSAVLKAIEDSTIVRMLNGFVESVQNKLSGISETSFIAKNIDNLILMVLSLLIISIPLLSTGKIGLIAVAAFSLLVVKYLCVKGQKHRFVSFDLPVLLYMIIAGLSVTFSSLLFPSIKGYVKMLIYFGGYLTFLNIFKNSPKRVIYMLGLLTLTASCEAFYGIYQQVAGVEALASWQDLSEVNPEQLMNRIYGTLLPFNPNLLGGYLIAGFSTALGFSFWALVKKKIRLCIPAFIGTFAILLAIVFTGSRGAYIAAAAMSLVFMLVSGHIIWHDLGHIKWLKKLWLGLIIAGVVLTILAVLSSPALQHRILSIFILRGDSSNSYRFNVYAACLKMISDNWLTGIGTGNTTFRLIYGLYMVTGFDALGAYNILLEVTVEMGIFGLLVFCWLILMSIVKSVKYIYQSSPLENKIIVSSCMIGIIGLMAHGLVDTVWYRPQINLIFWMMIAILSTYLTGRLNSQSQ